jgi:hypothetical protein
VIDIRQSIKIAKEPRKTIIIQAGFISKLYGSMYAKDEKLL